MSGEVLHRSRSGHVPRDMSDIVPGCPPTPSHVSCPAVQSFRPRRSLLVANFSTSQSTVLQQTTPRTRRRYPDRHGTSTPNYNSQYAPRARHRLLPQMATGLHFPVCIGIGNHGDGCSKLASDWLSRACRLLSKMAALCVCRFARRGWLWKGALAPRRDFWSRSR